MISEPKNPYQFNYKSYLKKKTIHRQITILNKEVFFLKKNTNSVNGLAHTFRVHIHNSLLKSGFKDDELAIINALLLGQRQDMSKELIANYSRAGAIHILAVSGLHVGIILLLISFLLKPLKRLLWGFAFIAGTSASVVRAVTMFTAVSIGLAVDRKNSVYRNLIISLFFLLLINPYYLFEIGFQLSYIAVFSIVWLQPIIVRFWKPKWKVIHYFWQLFTVSLAAQIGVLPLSLYYFHQFPGLFFVANLIIIPILGFILGLGILVILLSLVLFISWIADQKSFVVQEIYFSLVFVFAFYIFIVFSFRWIQNRSIINFKYALFSLLILQGVFIYEKQKHTRINELVIFNKSSSSALALQKNRKITIHKSAHFSKNNTILESYKTGNYSHKTEVIDSIKNVFKMGRKTMLVIDSLGVYKLRSLKPDYILLIQSPKINLERLIEELKPKLIIADASNYTSYIKNWQKTCFATKTKFYYTQASGAYREKW